MHNRYLWRLICAIALAVGSFTYGAVGAEDFGHIDEAGMSREQWYSRLKWAVTDCPLESQDKGSSGVIVHDFGAGASIIQVECERWAYQGTHLFYLRKGAAVTPLSFDQFESPDTGRLEKYHSPSAGTA